MSVAIVTGSGGLIGSETVRSLCDKGFEVAGIDNDMRRTFFGAEASTSWNQHDLEKNYPNNYKHHNLDIRDQSGIFSIFEKYGTAIELVVHTAAQPSHDWAVKEPFTDFTVNANGTLTMLEATRKYCPNAVFIFTSTNKVYGDTPNTLPLVELETRWEIDPAHPFYQGIDESMSIDTSLHSLFGASKVAADVMVQEYGRYFGMRTVCFRGGCLTGPNHSGTALHGFLSYLMKCVYLNKPYTIYGYKGKQVRDNIHSADLVAAFFEFYKAPPAGGMPGGEVYNMGGSRFSNCSMLEAIQLCQEITGKELSYTYTETNRIGDHIWYISDISKFQKHYPQWQQKYNVRQLLEDIYVKNAERWLATEKAV
ncbi:MAG: NAD-dependent epimerase/dehydratase family protein [Chloroflexi bacterium]|nr:NAD-dependent epimerase/dehydratase family protein [Chloroflexota bacterium]OJV93164.1 MAG: NAD-dependent epimerase [Chloroflexi bacterium 54-19]